MPFSMRTGCRSSARGAGGLSTLPVMSNDDAWDGQIMALSCAFQGTVHPRCVHSLEIARKPPSAGSMESASA